MPTVAEGRSETMAAVLKRLAVPPSRVLMRPWPGTATEKDLLKALRTEKRLCELVDGTLVEKPMGQGETGVGGWLSMLLAPHLLSHDLGYLIPETGMTRLRPGLVRAPDIAFLRWEKVPGRKIDMSAIRAIPPDLAVEVISRTNTRPEIDRRIREYFAAGAVAVWVVNPARRTFAVYSSPADFAHLAETDTLSGDPLFPGLNLPLRRLWDQIPQARPRRRRRRSS